MPERWRFEYECECPPTLEPGCARVGNHITSIELSSPIQVTPSLVTPTTDGSSYDTKSTISSLQLKRGTPGVGFGTPKRLPSDRPYTDSNGVLGLGLLLVLVLGVCKSKSKPQHKPDTPTHNQAKRCRGVPSALRRRRMSITILANSPRLLVVVVDPSRRGILLY